MPDFSTPPAQSVLGIFSLSYSGSSMLNLLLDQQEGVRGLGECYHIYRGDRECYCSCGHHLKHCAFFQSITADNFYEQCFSHYDCRVLVDASKVWENFEISRDSRFPLRAILLSKTPHAWLYSHLQHHPGNARDIVTMFGEYAYFYRRAIEQLVEQGILFNTLTYEDLVADPYRQCQRACDPFRISVDPQTMTGPWTTDTHIVGGNQAVYHQLQPVSTFFDSSSKYQDKKGMLFLDAAWKDDLAFRALCTEAYRVIGPVIDPILERLGHLPSGTLIEDLDESPVLQPVTLT